MAPYRLTPYRPGAGMLSSDPLTSLHREVNRMFDDVSRGALPAQKRGSGRRSIWLTAHMIRLLKPIGEFRITAEAAGGAEDDIEIRLVNDLLNIERRRKYPHWSANEQEQTILVERALWHLSAICMRLPTPVDPERVSASLRKKPACSRSTLPKSGETRTLAPDTCSRTASRGKPST